MISIDGGLLISKTDCALATSPVHLEKDLFPKSPTTDVATVDDNSLGGQCPSAHVILVEAESSLKTQRVKIKKKKNRKTGRKTASCASTVRYLNECATNIMTRRHMGVSFSGIRDAYEGR